MSSGCGPKNRASSAASELHHQVLVHAVREAARVLASQLAQLGGARSAAVRHDLERGQTALLQLSPGMR